MAKGERKKETNLSGRIHKLTVYQEVIKWKEDFRWSKFFQLFIFVFTDSTMGGKCVSRELPVTVNPLRRQGKPPLVLV